MKIVVLLLLAAIVYGTAEFVEDTPEVQNVLEQDDDDSKDVLNDNIDDADQYFGTDRSHFNALYHHFLYIPRKLYGKLCSVFGITSIVILPRTLELIC